MPISVNLGLLTRTCHPHYTNGALFNTRYYWVYMPHELFINNGNIYLLIRTWWQYLILTIFFDETTHIQSDIPTVGVGGCSLALPVLFKGLIGNNKTYWAQPWTSVENLHALWQRCEICQASLLLANMGLLFPHFEMSNFPSFYKYILNHWSVI